jgi:hypothetical protein
VARVEEAGAAHRQPPGLLGEVFGGGQVDGGDQVGPLALQPVQPLLHADRAPGPGQVGLVDVEGEQPLAGGTAQFGRLLPRLVGGELPHQLVHAPAGGPGPDRVHQPH